MGWRDSGWPELEPEPRERQRKRRKSRWGSIDRLISRGGRNLSGDWEKGEKG